MQRDAEFIWTPDQAIATELSFRDFIGSGPNRREDGRNRWYLFRKTFKLSCVPATGTIDLTADGRYRLFVNGDYVGRGPSRCSPYFQRVDRYDVAEILQAGDNVIAILVHVYGLDTAWYETVKDYWQSLFGDGGLYCVLQADELRIVTDPSWCCLEADAWTRDTALSGWGQDFIEEFDARKMPDGWTDTGFDDCAWKRAQVLIDGRDDSDRAKGFGPIRAFPTLIPRDIPQLVEEEVFPTRLLATYTVQPDPTLALDERIYGESLHTCPDGFVENAAAMLVDDDSTALLRTTAEHDVCVVLAFDNLNAGFPFIEIEATGGEVIEVAVAETYVGEFDDARGDSPRLSRRSFLDCAHVFRYIATEGLQRFQKFEWTAVRYLQLVVRNAPDGIRIRRIGNNTTHYPVENQGEYKCSDDFLNRLWKIGRHTVLQCSHDAWEDCPGREKRQWVGDGVARYPIAAAAFGTSVQALDRRFLLQCLEAQRTDGLLQMYAPGDHKTWGVVIPDYGLHYVLIAHEYLMHTGDLDTLETILPGIQRILDWFARHVGAQQLLVDIPYWHFVEWADVGRSGAATCINALYAAALERAAEIARHLEYTRPATRYAECASGVRDAINGLLWDNDRGVYVDGLDPESGCQNRRVSQQANALVMAFGIAPDERSAAVLDYISDGARVKLTAVPPVVPTAAPFDEASDVVQCNTFFSHFLYSAFAKHGRFEFVIEHIRDNYGPMLAAGATTLWESFDSSASLCHAFSATPVYQLSAFSLGVRPTRPGFAGFVVAPQFCDLGFAEGCFPTPRGPIAVRWQRQGANVELEVDVPEGLWGTVVVPPGFDHGKESLDLAGGRKRISLTGNAEHG